MEDREGDLTAGAPAAGDTEREMEFGAVCRLEREGKPPERETKMHWRASLDLDSQNFKTEEQVLIQTSEIRDLICLGGGGL